MGADLLMYAIPNCKMTKERMVVLKQIVAALPDCGGGDAMYDDLDEYKAALVTAIDELIGIDGCRDVTTIGDSLITGGLSWGDHPTESADCFDKISMCNPLWKQLEAWYLEDHPPSPPTAPPLCVQKLILAAESILANARDSGSYGPDSHGGLDDAEMADYPRDEDGDVWFDDFWTLKEALAACMYLVE